MEGKGNAVLRTRREKQVSSCCGITERERRILGCPVKGRGGPVRQRQSGRLEGGKEEEEESAGEKANTHSRRIETSYSHALTHKLRTPDTHERDQLA